jgi:hypothetical protein
MNQSLSQKDTKKKDSTMNLESEAAKAEKTASANDSKEIQPKVVSINPKEKPAVNHKE